MAEATTSFVDKYAKGRPAPGMIGADAATRPNADPAAATKDTLSASDRDTSLHRKNVAFTTVKGVAIGLISVIAAAGISSTIRQSWEKTSAATLEALGTNTLKGVKASQYKPRFKGPVMDDMVKGVSNIIGITVAGFFGYSNFLKAKEHNKDVEEERQERGR